MPLLQCHDADRSGDRLQRLGRRETETQMLYWEDIEVGARSRFGSYQVTREEVIEFASKYDPQPFHLSDEAAAQTHFGRLAASGWHTCAMMMRMLVEHMAAQDQAGLGSPGVDELRWFKPVHPGDILRAESEVLEKTPSRSRPEMGSFRSRTTVFNQNSEPVMSLISIGLIRRRPEKG
jgi:acyl dehydratase